MEVVSGPSAQPLAAMAFAAAGFLDGRRVLVVGAGRTGVAVSRFLASRGARVTLADQKASDRLESAFSSLSDTTVTIACVPGALRVLDARSSR